MAKRYVTEFANDILKSDAKNTLMRPDIKAARKKKIEEILFEYKGGFTSSREAVMQLASV